MNRPLFSIATPCWNSKNTIERTIQSVLTQDFKDYEYLIVDGGSTDGTLDILRQYEPLFEGRMHWISEPDNGLYDAFNKGVERSMGIYCWNVNADDYLSSGVLKRLAEQIETFDSSCLPIITGYMNFVSQDGEIISMQKSTNDRLKEAFENDYIGVLHPATLVPKEIYVKYGLFDTYYKIIGDADWFHRVYEGGVQFVFVDFVLSNMSDGGVSNQFNYIKSFRDRIYFLRKFYKNPFTRLAHWVKWTYAFYSLKRNHSKKK